MGPQNNGSIVWNNRNLRTISRLSLHLLVLIKNNLDRIFTVLYNCYFCERVYIFLKSPKSEKAPNFNPSNKILEKLPVMVEIAYCWRKYIVKWMERQADIFSHFVFSFSNAQKQRNPKISSVVKDAQPFVHLPIF